MRREASDRPVGASAPPPQVPDALLDNMALPPSTSSSNADGFALGGLPRDGKVKLCDIHGNDLQPLTCSSCKAVFHMLRKAVRQQLVVDGAGAPSAVPDTRERLVRGRSDSLPATLVFTDQEVDLHQTIHGQGKFRRGHFDDITKKFYRLTPAHHKLLVKNIESEDLFTAYANDKKFDYIFQYKKDVLTCVRQLRVSTRPFVLAMSNSTDLARHVRKAGEDAGYKYPEEPPEVPMRGPTPVVDCLTPSETKDTFPLPGLTDPTEGVIGLDDLSRSMIRTNHDSNLAAMVGFRETVAKQFDDFYQGVSKCSLALDNNLTSTSQLIGHVDGCLTDLARTKLLSMFKGRARGRSFFGYSH